MAPRKAARCPSIRATSLRQAVVWVDHLLKSHPSGSVRLGLAVGMALLLAGCARHVAPPAPGPPKVTVVTLQVQPVPITTELPGRVTAYRTAEVRPQVNGVILKRLFVVGGE